MTIKELEQLDPCKEGIDYVKKKGSIRKAWEDSERGDWMLWYAKKAGADVRALTLAKAKCDRLVEHLMKDERSKKALEVMERFGNGKATREELDEAGIANAAAVADAYDAAYAATGREKIKAQCADICREVLTDELFGMKNPKDNE